MVIDPKQVAVCLAARPSDSSIRPDITKLLLFQAIKGKRFNIAPICIGGGGVMGLYSMHQVGSVVMLSFRYCKALGLNPNI